MTCIQACIKVVSKTKQVMPSRDADSDCCNCGSDVILCAQSCCWWRTQHAASRTVPSAALGHHSYTHTPTCNTIFFFGRAIVMVVGPCQPVLYSDSLRNKNVRR